MPEFLGSWASCFCALTLLAPLCNVHAAETSPSASTLPVSAPAASTLPASADAKPLTTAPGPTVNVAVTEWVIFVANPLRWRSQRAANPLRRRFLLHEAIRGRQARTRTKKRLPVLPIGVIRIASNGPVADDDKIDIQLTYKEGRTFATWPTAKDRSSGMLWRDIQLVASGAMDPPCRSNSVARAPLPAPPHAPLLQVGEHRDSFLLYDVTLKYPPALTLDDSNT